MGSGVHWRGMVLTAAYCHACAAVRGYLYPLPADVLGTRYQVEKFAKHALPHARHTVQGIFTSTEAKVYADYIIDARAAGGVVIDTWGTWNRYSIVLCAGRQVGYHYEYGQLIAPADAIQLVLSSDAGRLHAYPIRSSTVTGLPCATPGCPRPVLVVPEPRGLHGPLIWTVEPRGSGGPYRV